MARYVIVSILFVLFSAELFGQAAVCSYSYRKRITIDPTKVVGPTDFTNFPVLIDISSDNNLRTVANSGHVQNASGFDIVFTAEDGVTLLEFQTEKYVATTGQLRVWIKVPVLSTSLNTYLYMYYGNSSISTSQATTSVWSGYYGAWHFENNSVNDNSANAQNFTNNGTTSLSAGFIGEGRTSTGTNWLELSSFPNLTSNFSMSAWIYCTNNAKSGQRVFCDDQNNSGGYALSVGDAGTGNLRFFSRASNPVILDAPNNTILNNTWYHVVGVADITNQRKTIYVNGVAVATGTFTNAWGTDVGNATSFGENASGETANRLVGNIDELRVASSALTASWVATEYNNQSSPSTFYSISTEPNVFNGASNVNWTTNANWSSGSAPTASVDVILSAGTNQPNLNTDFQVNALWVRPSTTLTIGNGRLLQVLMDVTNCGVIVGGNNTSELEMNGTNASTPNQYLSGDGSFTLRDLTINNTNTVNPSVILNTSVNVSSDLTLSSGVVYTGSTNILALGTAAASNAGSASSYVSGPMSKDGTAAFVFPVGKNGKWRRIRISAPTSSSNFRAEYFSSAFSSTTPVNSPLNNVSSGEFWQLDRLTGTGSASISLYWESASASGINNCPDLTIARWNGSAWAEVAGTTISGSSCSGTGAGTVITNATNASFSPFTFGSKLSSVNPLPIKLSEFKVECQGTTAAFTWKTQTEKNNKQFNLQFSEGTGEWLNVAAIEGNGTTSLPQNYRYNLSPYSKGYYRLQQQDEDGNKTNYDALYLNCEPATVDAFEIMPNPIVDFVQLKFNLQNNYGAGTLTIYDQMGARISVEEINLHKGTFFYRSSAVLAPGLYFLSISNSNLLLPSKRVLVH